MLRCFDPNSGDGAMAPEDEFATFCKAMGCPHTIATTEELSSHDVLNALDWLLGELHQEIETSVTNDKDTGCCTSLKEELTAATDEIFSKFLADTFTPFSRGEEEKEQQLEDEFVERLAKDDRRIEKAIAEARSQKQETFDKLA